MITVVCKCEKCGHEWIEEDVRIVPPGQFEKAETCEYIRCPECNAIYGHQVKSS